MRSRKHNNYIPEENFGRRLPVEELNFVLLLKIQILGMEYLITLPLGLTLTHKTEVFPNKKWGHC